MPGKEQSLLKIQEQEKVFQTFGQQKLYAIFYCYYFNAPRSFIQQTFSFMNIIQSKSH